MQVGRGGSGVIVHVEGGKALVLTCRHVADAVGMPTITVGGRTAKAVGDVFVDKTNADLAMFVIDADEDTVAIDVAAADVQHGDEVVQLGHPNGGPMKGRSGLVKSLTQSRVFTSLMVATGDSGSGMFRNGKLVGIIAENTRARTEDSREYPGIAVCLPQVRRFVDACRERLRERLRLPPLEPRPKKMPEAPPEVPEVKPETPKAPYAQPGPAGPSGPAGKDGADGAPGRDGKDADMAAIQKMIDAGFAKIKVVPGPAGPQGPPGPAGKDADATPLLIELEKLRAANLNLAKEVELLRQQKYTAELYSIDGQLVRRATFGKDEPLKMFLLPVK